MISSSVPTVGPLPFYPLNFLHFHGGTDIAVPKDTQVTAISNGVIYNQPDKTAAPNGRVTINSGGDKGWTYLHMSPGLNQNETPPRVYAKDDQVNATNSAIGKVQERDGANFPDHLHLEYGDGPDAYFNTSLVQTLNFSYQPAADPLDLLTPLGDSIGPTVPDVYFRYGTNDSFGDSNGKTSAAFITPAGNAVEQQETWSEAHRYFKELDYSNAIIMGARATSRDFNNNIGGGDSAIDIIGEVYDRVLNQGRKLGIKSIGFNLVGIKLGRTAFELKSFDFKGEFAPDTKNAGRQTQESLRDAALVRTAYENDAELHHDSSTDNFFYTVTNTDGDQLVQANDRTKSWITGAIEGSAWNAVGAQLAPNNAKSSYPDDYYNITVTARDQAGNSGVKIKRVLLDNYEQILNAVKVPSLPDDPAGSTRAKFSGTQWTGNSTVKVYLTKATIPGGGLPAGGIISAHGVYVGVVPTDVNGTIPETELVIPAYDAQNIATQLVGDYHNGNDIYEPRLDAVTELIIVEERPSVQNDKFVGVSIAQAGVFSSTVPVVTPPTTPAQPVQSGAVSLDSTVDRDDSILPSIKTVTQLITIPPDKGLDPLDPGPFAFL